MLAATRAHGQPIDRFSSAQRARIDQITRSATQLLTEWLGPPGSAIDLGDIPRRWLLPERDRSLERSVIASITRQFWASQSPTPFQEALIVYSGTRAIHDTLEGSNFLVLRFFGGIIPWPLRSVLLSPPVADPRPRVWQFDELRASPEAERLVRGLQTLERYTGWPTMAQTLAAIRAANRTDAPSFASTLSRIRGTNLNALVHECFNSEAVFDYAIEAVESIAVANGLRESRLTVLRAGNGVFATGDGDDRERSMPLLVSFADGTELRDWFDGAAPSTTMVYTASSPVASAAIDPELMLLLDVNRSNNTYTVNPAPRPLGIRLALHWMAWLQQTMLAYSALV